MPDLRFSVPYNNDFESLKYIAELDGTNGNHIEEIYFSGVSALFGSGRQVAQVNLDAVVKTIDFCKKTGIKSNLVMNTTCEGHEWYSPVNASRVICYVKKLHADGLDTITVANPIYMQKIRKEVLGLTIVVSVFSGVDTVQKALFYKKFGADIITPNEINRNLELLKEIKETAEVDLRLMANEGCLYGCPYRLFHENFTSHASKVPNTNARDICAEQCCEFRKLDPSQLLKSDWIRPEDVHRYKKITSLFKIVGRTMPTPWVLNTTKAYMEESYNGNLLDLMESTILKVKQQFHASINNKSLGGFFEKVTVCDKNCKRCGYCDELAKKVVKFG